MKFYKYISPLLLLIFVWIGVIGNAQEWSEPVNISPDLPGLDNQPDLCIDPDGTLHCVFTHKLDQNWRKIFYAKSIDDGATWTTPEDISLNEDTSLMNPHIICDTNNILYVAYDHNTGNPTQTMIFIKTFNGTGWSAPEIITEGLPGSDHNQLVIDHSNRIYCFWYRNGESNYKYYEDGSWSEMIIPYPDEYYWLIGPVTVDDDNNLHCAGVWLEEGQTIYSTKVIYFKYLYDEESWTDKTFISGETYIGANNLDIDIDNAGLSHVAYRQNILDTIPFNDSTMYTHDNGTFWTDPELVVNDPYEQRIAVDPYNRIHIVDKEKSEDGYKLVHYMDYGGFWQGYIIDNSNINISNPKLIEFDNTLYFVYYNCSTNDDCKIMFSNNYLITGQHRNKAVVMKLDIYPNPFKNKTIINFKISKEAVYNSAIYDINGNLIKTILKNERKSGELKFTWNGRDNNGLEMNKGTYIIRIQSGNYIISKPILYCK